MKVKKVTIEGEKYYIHYYRNIYGEKELWEVTSIENNKEIKDGDIIRAAKDLLKDGK
jgi:hypothetical protein